MHITTADILMTAFLVIMAVLTYLVAPLLKAKYGTETQTQLMQLCMTAVEAAEQIYTQSGMGKVKKEYVLDYLRDRGYNVDEITLDNMIEACVLELKRGAAA